LASKKRRGGEGAEGALVEVRIGAIRGREIGEVPHRRKKGKQQLSFVRRNSKIKKKRQ